MSPQIYFDMRLFLLRFARCHSARRTSRIVYSAPARSKLQDFSSEQLEHGAPRTLGASYAPANSSKVILQQSEVTKARERFTLELAKANAIHVLAIRTRVVRWIVAVPLRMGIKIALDAPLPLPMALVEAPQECLAKVGTQGCPMPRRKFS